MTKAVFITVRTGSSRLPNKCLLEISKEKRSIDFLIDRLVGKGYFLVLCTSTAEEDDVLECAAKSRWVNVFRGSEEDKMKRWIDCARVYNVDFFVSADGDDLLVEPELIDLAFKQHNEKGHKFIKCEQAPTGAFSWGMDVKSLERIYEIQSKKTTNTEMCSCWFDDVHEIENIPEEFKRKDIRLTLDYAEDLLLFRIIIGEIGNVPLRDVLKFLDNNPDIKSINISREKDFKKNQDRMIKEII